MHIGRNNDNNIGGLRFQESREKLCHIGKINGTPGSNLIMRPTLVMSVAHPAVAHPKVKK